MSSSRSSDPRASFTGWLKRMSTQACDLVMSSIAIPSRSSRVTEYRIQNDRNVDRFYMVTIGFNAENKRASHGAIAPWSDGAPDYTRSLARATPYAQ